MSNIARFNPQLPDAQPEINNTGTGEREGLLRLRQVYGVMRRHYILIAVVTIIWQFTNIWNDFLFGASFAGLNAMPMTVALNNLVNSSTGVREYNVHFAGAIMAALPTLLVYIVAGRFFVRGLMAGSVKG